MLRDHSRGAAAAVSATPAVWKADTVSARAWAAVDVRGVPGPWRVVTLVAADALALLAAGFVAVLATAGLAALSHPAAGSIAPLVPLFIVSFALAGLYPGFDVSAIHLIRTLSLQTSLVFLVIAGCVYVLPLASEAPAAMFVVWWAASLVLLPFMRLQAAALAARWRWWREPVLLFGTVERLQGIIRSLANAQHLGYRPVAVVLTSPGLDPPAAFTPLNLPVVPEPDAVAAARVMGVRTILFAGGPAAEQKAADLRHHFRHVIMVNTLESPLVEPTAVRYLGNAIGVEYRNGLLMRRNQVVKRIIDVVAALAGLVLLFPFAALAALLIMVCSPGRWWHTQWREGRGGIPFRIWKLRTMYLDAEDRLTTHLAGDAAARAEWQREFKLSSDPRIIPFVGGVLRRWSLDEYPQFWNVIRGEMSLVGPRALPSYHLEAFDAEFRALRRHVRPGLTGMWQVMSRGRGAIGAQEALDRYYIYNWSIWMDIFVLAKTTLAVITRRGAR